MNQNGASPDQPNTGDGAMGGPWAKPNYEYWWAVGIGIIYALVFIME